MLKVMMLFMMVFLSLEAVDRPIFKTGQTESYNDSGVVVTDDSVKDDGFYKAGLTQRYTRSESNNTVTDNVTMLEWRDNGYFVGTWSSANSACSALDLDSKTDWRLPSKEELESIIDRGEYNPTMNDVFIFYKSTDAGYWSATTNAKYNAYAWRVNFYGGGSDDDGDKIRGSAYRCVRGTAFNDSVFTRNAINKTVTNSVTNLQWQDDSDANTTQKTWLAAIEYCETLDMADQTDWRLPNLNELLNIVDSSRYDPAINIKFENVSWNYYWSSTTNVNNRRAEVVRFNSGWVYNKDKSDAGQYTRCVRGGQFDKLKLKTLTKTGQTKSYDAGGSEVTDGSIKDDGYYQAGFKRSYTRNDTTEIVTDNTTKLEWQDDVYAVSNDTNWSEAGSYCSTLDLNGEAGWRLPSKEELESIVDLGNSDSSLSGDFNNTYSYYYWSSTINASNADEAWIVHFYGGYAAYYAKTTSHYIVRCVRGGEFDNLNFTRNAITEIVTDSVTNLQWQDNADVNDSNNKKSWTEAIEYCEVLDMSDQIDWRLPNLNELLSVVDSSRYDSAINNTFTKITSDNYWSSSTANSLTSYAWSVDFNNSSSAVSHKVNSNYNIRCVRGGEVESKVTTIAPIIMYLLN